MAATQTPLIRHATKYRYSARLMSFAVASATPSPIQGSLTVVPGYWRGHDSFRPKAPAMAPSGQPALKER